MVVSRGMRVAIGKVQMAWRRRDVRRAARHQQVADQAVVLEPEPAEPIGEVVGVILPADDAAA
jgi:hypothetical protein